MNFKSIAEARYTTKKYDPAKKIPESQITELKEILKLSPSSINSQPWKFTFVSSDEVKNQLAAVSYFNDVKVKDASHVVVFSVINSIELFEQQIKKNLPEGPVAYYNQFIKPKSEDEIKAWMSHQVYLSLGFFLSACAAMGIDSTPMEGIKNDEYGTILGLENYRPLFAVAIGYRDTEDANQPTLKPKSRLALEEVVAQV
ncbi:nitroreductase family protein [Fulvivirga ulvae]|uniref:nitroreductase family protein n=1 Tax=Fulvivirga ulvae TaxID=2904245 RepID=UPI001F424AA9|nr:nitroreductase family protein [Fulvivirga ulvae]UII29677.1 nitroreductase family protein [Fulvivirga ulvae]